AFSDCTKLVEESGIINNNFFVGPETTQCCIHPDTFPQHPTTGLGAGLLNGFTNLICKDCLLVPLPTPFVNNVSQIDVLFSYHVIMNYRVGVVQEVPQLICE